MQKKSKMLCLLLALAIPLAIVSMFISKVDFYSLSRASFNGYAIEFNQSNNKFHNHTGNVAYDGTANVRTKLGNSVEFAYYQVKGLATTWHVLGSGGYFNNVDPIHGIESINISFKTDSSFYSIYYSKDNSFDQHVDFVSSISEPQVFTFNGYQPNYFKIVNTSGSNFNISSIELSLNCLNNYPYISLSSNDINMGSVIGEGSKTANTEITIQAIPNSGYKFVGWYDGESLVSTEPNYTFIIGHEDLDYAAVFTYEKYNLIVQSESLEKGSASDSSGQYDYLSEITIEANPNEGYSFAGWYSGNTLISIDNPYTFNMPYAEIIYTAKFSINSYSLLINNSSPELGSVNGGGDFLCNQSVTLTATPNTGVGFLGWYDENDELISSNSVYVFDMPNNDLEYTAKFEFTPYAVTLTINDELMGNISGGGSYTYQQIVVLNAFPFEHYSFVGWYDGDHLLSSDNSYTFNMPNYSVTYEAKFTKNYKLFVSSDDETMGTVNAPIEWGSGLEVTIQAIANNNYDLDYWYDENLNSVSEDLSYSFIMPNHDVYLFASFTVGYYFRARTEDASKGTTSGSGYYKIGRTVNVDVNMIDGFFKGWCDTGGKIISTSKSYSFKMKKSSYYLIALFWSQDEVDNYYIKPTKKNNDIYYGLYPQHVISDEKEANVLTYNAIRDNMRNGWYFYEGNYYAKATAVKPSTDLVKREFSDGKTVESGKEYWFRCEPILWTRIDITLNDCYISNYILDSYYYYEDRNAERVIDDEVIYPSNYEHSDVRNWINNDFYDTAFNFGNDYLDAIMIDEKFEDNVFLVKTTELKYYVTEKTDWAIARGPSPGDGFWCRDDSEYKNKAYSRSKYGINDFYVDTVRGIRPVLNIVLD